MTSIGLIGRDCRVTHGMESTFVPQPEPDPRPRLLYRQDRHSTGHSDASGVSCLWHGDDMGCHVSLCLGLGPLGLQVFSL